MLSISASVPVASQSRTRSRARRTVRVGTLLLVGGGVLFASAPAYAHVEIAPEKAAPSQFLEYTVTVPNERDDFASTEVDLTLPQGFQLDAAQQVTGWEIVIGKASDGTPNRVTWKNGRIPVGTYATFALQGRNPRAAGSLTWRATQRYEHSVVVQWTGAPGSATPAPVVRLSGQAAASADPQTPATQTATNQAASGVDRLARSRAALAIAMAAAGLFSGLVIATAAAGRRRRGGDDDIVGEHSKHPFPAPKGAAAAPAQPAPTKGRANRVAPHRGANATKSRTG